ncbi:hypothetical protein ACGFWF_43360 [Streptomyces sp. NPDC048581]
MEIAGGASSSPSWFSGSGKSTTLMMIAGFCEPDFGPLNNGESAA